MPTQETGASASDSTGAFTESALSGAHEPWDFLRLYESKSDIDKEYRKLAKNEAASVPSVWKADSQWLNEDKHSNFALLNYYKKGFSFTADEY